MRYMKVEKRFIWVCVDIQIDGRIKSIDAHIRYPEN